MERTQIKKDVLLLFIVSTAVILWNLGAGSICSWDEGLYGGVTREMIKTGDWKNLRWAGAPWVDKPPLYMWMTGIFSLFFGLNEFSVRLFSALCGIGTVITVYFSGARLYSRNAGIASSLVLLSTWHFIWSSKMGMLDVPLTFFITLSLYLFVLGEKYPLSLFLSPVFFGLAFMTKGMGAMLIPIILFFYILTGPKLRILKSPFLLSGIITGIALALIWHIVTFAHYGDSFIRDYFIKHLLIRTTKAVEGHTGDFFTYFGVIPNKGRPFAGIALGLFPIILFRMKYFKEKQHLLPVIWILTVFLLFSMVKTKLHWYIMPAYPALSLITGFIVAKIFKKKTFIIMLIASTVSLSYLAFDKNIFEADYSPETKNMFLEIKNIKESAGCTLYLYGISDPGAQFYLGEIAENIADRKSIPAILKQTNALLFINKGSLENLRNIDYETLFENDNYLLIRTAHNPNPKTLDSK